MKVTVLAFARLRELLGSGSQQLQMQDGASVGDVWDMLSERFVSMAPLAASTRIARNGRIVNDPGERLEDGDEVALLPPAGGG